jgi:hypothetical protein
MGTSKLMIVVPLLDLRVANRTRRLQLTNVASADIARQIDENEALPYKPRQLSAMTRLDRGRLIWAGDGLYGADHHYRTSSHQQAIARSAENHP